jgi:hypothetical protein
MSNKLAYLFKTVPVIVPEYHTIILEGPLMCLFHLFRLLVEYCMILQHLPLIVSNQGEVQERSHHLNHPPRVLRPCGVARMPLYQSVSQQL